MNLLLAIMIAHLVASIAFAAWATWKIRRLRISVNLAHGDVEELKFKNWEADLSRPAA